MTADRQFIRYGQAFLPLFTAQCLNIHTMEEETATHEDKKIYCPVGASADAMGPISLQLQELKHKKQICFCGNSLRIWVQIACCFNIKK